MEADTETKRRSEVTEVTSEPDHSVAPACLERVARRRRRRLFFGHFFLLLFVVMVVYYQADVYENRTQRSNAQISVNVHDAPRYAQNDRSAVIFFDGFGSYDSDYLADTLAPGVKRVVDGESWSVSYGNAPLASERISELILELAEERGKSQLDLVGYSMGGIIGTEVAALLSEHPEVTVRSIILASTPDGFDGLRRYQQQELDFAQAFSSIPGAQYSTALRFIGEVYFMRDRFTTGSLADRAGGFVNALRQADTNISGPKFPGTWLLVDQAFAVSTAELEREMETIAEHTGADRPLPTMLYLGTAPPAHDYMVNDSLSGGNICQYATEHYIPCHIRSVPGAVHTMPSLSVEEYETVLAGVQGAIQADIIRAQFQHRLRMMEEEGQLVSQQGTEPEGAESDGSGDTDGVGDSDGADNSEN